MHKCTKGVDASTLTRLIVCTKGRRSNSFYRVVSTRRCFDSVSFLCTPFLPRQHHRRQRPPSPDGTYIITLARLPRGRHSSLSVLFDKACRACCLLRPCAAYSRLAPLSLCIHCASLAISLLLHLCSFLLSSLPYLPNPSISGCLSRRFGASPLTSVLVLFLPINLAL